MSLSSILTGNHILMMSTEGGSGGGGGGPPPPAEAEARLRQQAQESLKQQAERELQLTNQIVQAQITSTEQLKKQQQIMENISKTLGESFQAQQQFLDQAQINITNFSESFRKVSENAEDAGQRSAALSEEYAGLEKTNKSLFDALMNISNTAENAEDAAKQFEELKGELQLAQASGKEFDTTTKGIAKSLGFAGKISDTFVGSLGKQLLKFKELNTEAGRAELYKSMANSIQETFDPFNLASSLLDNLIKSALEFDKAAKNLSASFGTMGAFQDQLVANSGEIARMGLTATQQAELVTELTTQFSSFTAELEKNQRMLKLNNAALKSLGVSTSKANEIIEVMNTGLGRSVEESSRLTVSLAANAAAFGKTSEQMVSDFASMSGYLASYGDDMEEMFLAIQKEAKRTGIAVSKLGEMAKAFDTFSGSAKTAAQMNALFGTNLSAMGLNSMNAEERLAELKREIGSNVDSMNRYQKMALAEVLPGINSVAEAVQFMGGTLSKEESAQIDAINLQKDMSLTLQDLAKATLPLAKQFELMFSELTSNEEMVSKIVSATKSLSMLLLALTENIEMTTATFVAFSVVGKAIPFLLHAIAKGTMSIGKASLYAFGTLGLIVTVLMFIFDIFHLTRSPAFYLLFGVVAAGIFAMGMAAQTTQVGLYALAAAALAIGIAVSAVFYTLSMAIDSFTDLFTVMSEGAENFPKAAAGLYLMAGGMISLGAAGLYASTGLGAALAALSALTAIFNLGGSDIEDLVKAGDSVTKMGDSVGKFGSGLEKIKAVAMELKNSIGDSMIAATMEGQKMSVIVGKEASVATLFQNDTLNIKVDMPTINIPTPKFDIYLDGKVIDARIEKRNNK